MNVTRQYSGIMPALIVCLPLALAAGCSSTVDPDYQAPTGNLHPFEQTGQHGAYLAASGYDFPQCTACHGANLHGQATGPGGGIVRSCTACHSSENHLIGFTEAAQQHAEYLRQNAWDLDACYVCHFPYGAAPEVDFGGSCSGGACHGAESGGPEACNTCHGDRSADATNPVSWAPPRDLSGNTATSEPGVGAHSAHLAAPSGFAAPVPCSACHHVPSEWDSPAHIDDDPGKVALVWDSPADAQGADPEYDYDTLTCSSTHCHGPAEPVWTQVDGTWSACGSCHALPPDSPHPPSSLTECANCHGDVIGTNGAIIAAELHVNGETDMRFDE
jgi:hypothetical protein